MTTKATVNLHVHDIDAIDAGVVLDSVSLEFGPAMHVFLYGTPDEQAAMLLKLRGAAEMALDKIRAQVAERPAAVAS